MAHRLASKLTRLIGLTKPDLASGLDESGPPSTDRLHSSPEGAHLAGFRIASTSGIGAMGGDERLTRIVDTFAPFQPVQSLDQLTGRSKQLEFLISAIEEQRGHAILMGLRGCGKTSLAKVLLSIASDAAYTTVYLSCSRSSTLESIFRSVLATIPRRYDSLLDPANEEELKGTFEELLVRSPVTPQVLGEILSRVTGTRVLVVLDDFDRHENLALSSEILELMKILSDHAAAAHLILVGVGAQIETLLHNLSMIPRSLVALKLPSMDDKEIWELVTDLTRRAGLEGVPTVVDRIVALSYGKPYLAKLVALKSSRMAWLRGSRLVEDSDFDASIDQFEDQLDTPAWLRARTFENGSLLTILKAVLRTSRNVGETMSAEEVAAHCEDGVGTVSEIERALMLLADRYKVLTVNSDQRGHNRFQINDPRTELAIAISCSRPRLGTQIAPSAEVPSDRLTGGGSDPARDTTLAERSLPILQP